MLSIGNCTSLDTLLSKLIVLSCYDNSLKQCMIDINFYLSRLSNIRDVLNDIFNAQETIL